MNVALGVVFAAPVAADLAWPLPDPDLAARFLRGDVREALVALAIIAVMTAFWSPPMQRRMDAWKAAAIARIGSVWSDRIGNVLLVAVLPMFALGIRAAIARQDWTDLAIMGIYAVLLGTGLIMMGIMWWRARRSARLLRRVADRLREGDE